MPHEKNEQSLDPILGLPKSEHGAANSELSQYTSEQLFHGYREVLIIHHNVTYRLRITKTDKLILTK